MRLVLIQAGMSNFLAKPCNAAKVKEARDQSVEFNERTRIYATSEPALVAETITVRRNALFLRRKQGKSKHVVLKLHSRYHKLNVT